MNFLAHLYLSGESKEIIIGNFIADAVRKSHHADFPPGIIEGIKLHYKIDEFTDTHPVVHQSKNRLRDKYGKYAPVIVDIFYDHFLAARWQSYSSEPLAEYALRMYTLLSDNHSSLPPKIHQLLPYMISGNWLNAYAYLDGIESTLQGMARRARFHSGMEKAIEDLKKDYHMYQREFELFFPDLIAFVAVERKGR